MPNKDSWKKDVYLTLENPKFRDRMYDMLEEFQDMWSGKLGQISAAKHRVKLESGAKPVYQVPYRAGHKATEFIREEVEKMQGEGVIEPATAEWASPVVLAPKKDGTMRFCVDYRKLNAITVRNSYPIPRMDDCIDALGDATIFTTLYCKWILAGGNRGGRARQNKLHLPQWPIPFHTDAVRTEKCPSHIPTGS